MKRVTIAEVRSTAKSIEDGLNEAGCGVKLSPYFAYGKYSYLMYFKNGRFMDMNLDTKKETLNNLRSKYYEVLANKEYYKS